jgi:hypothetical protein
LHIYIIALNKIFAIMTFEIKKLLL